MIARLTTLLNLLSVTVAVYQENACDSAGGMCRLTSQCSSGQAVSGKCPSQPNNVKCCIVYQEQACTNAGGACKLQSAGCTSGQFVSGKCPRQPSDVTCCTQSATDDESDGSVFQEQACLNAGGTCKLLSSGCSDGHFLSGKCPRQPSNVKCCVTSPDSGPSGSGECSNENKYEDTLNKIFASEGKCQNWQSDNGNNFRGKIGYTCMGIIPERGYQNQNEFSGCSGFTGHPADFVKWCHDKSPNNFRQGAKAIYKKLYIVNVCDDLEQPAFYVCSDISVNSGPGRARQFKNQLGTPTNWKDYARRLNDLHRSYYRRLGGRFLKGWLNRADERDRYIDSC